MVFISKARCWERMPFARLPHARGVFVPGLHSLPQHLRMERRGGQESCEIFSASCRGDGIRCSARGQGSSPILGSCPIRLASSTREIAYVPCSAGNGSPVWQCFSFLATNDHFSSNCTSW